MDRDIKRLIGVVVIGGVIFLLTRPKGLFKASSIKAKNLAQPKVAEASNKDYENSIIAIKAMRAAITAGEPAAVLEDINREILADYNIKVYQDTTSKKLYTCNRTGQEIAREK